MKISTKKKCDNLVRYFENLRKQGIDFEIRHGKYGFELTMVDNNAASPGDYIVAVLKTGM